MKWIDAIIEVLGSNGGAMHYVDIANTIMGKGLRKECKTPQNSVHVIVDGHADIFIKEGKGKYRLNSAFDYKSWHKNNKTTDEDECKAIESQITKSNNKVK